MLGVNQRCVASDNKIRFRHFNIAGLFFLNFRKPQIKNREETELRSQAGDKAETIIHHPIIQQRGILDPGIQNYFFSPELREDLPGISKKINVFRQKKDAPGTNEKCQSDGPGIFDPLKDGYIKKERNTSDRKSTENQSVIIKIYTASENKEKAEKKSHQDQNTELSHISAETAYHTGDCK